MSDKTYKGTRRHLPPGVMILHEDEHILVVEKPAGLLTMGTDKRKSGTLYFALTDYVRKGNAKSRNRIFIVHRLDRDASGVIVFAKSIEAKVRLQNHWDEVTKKYLAIVHGRMPARSGVITSYLIENNAQMVHSTRDEKKGKLSRTAYKVIEEEGDFSLLEIDLLTGRKNQIRVHLSEQGNAIVGDEKYGDKSKAHKHLALHARSIRFNHPSTGEQLEVTSEIPGYFKRLMRISRPTKDGA